MSTEQTKGAEVQEAKTQTTEKAAEKISATEKQFEVELEKVNFDSKGKKISKPQTQFMSVNAFIHFLKNAGKMGWTLKIKTHAKGLTDAQVKALNEAADSWNDVQDGEKGKKENQVSKFKK